jgi:hypothetical protein
MREEDPGIVEHSEGIVLNPMNQPIASKIALASAAEFLNNPTEYDVERSWVSAISEVALDVRRRWSCSASTIFSVRYTEIIPEESWSFTTN